MEPTPKQAHKAGYGTNTTAAKNGVYSLLLANKNVFTRLYLVTLDSRNARIVIIAGEESVIVINKQGELSYDQPEL